LSISQSLMNAFPDLNPEQKAIVGHIKGPLLVIAGPGSGKTHSLTLRAMNLLLLNKTAPKEIILCTFTEKAAFELRDRMSAVARKTNFTSDLSELQASTIHGLCHKIISRHRHRTPLGSNFETLDELTQLLFIYDHFDGIVGSLTEDLYLQRWKTKWGAIEGARDYFNKITEELVDPSELNKSEDEFLREISRAYLEYRRLLFENNRIDFAHLQRLAYDLLLDPEACASITSKVAFVMVDEYQDTNYIQEQILLKLAEKTGNLFVVGDEDQSLYRFRGATVRNILEFPQNVKNCTVHALTTNYRSHKRIIEAYDRWMASADWSNPRGRPFRYTKTIRPDDGARYPEYPAIFCIWGRNKKDEAERFADLVTYLIQSAVISDYSQVALLLHSVRQEHSGPYLEALTSRNIPAFCPRARGYFDNDEIRLMVACFAVIFGYYGEGRGEISGGALHALADYVDSCIVDLGRHYGSPHPLSEALKGFVSDVTGLQDGEALDMRPADFFYRLLALEPFSGFLKNENAARNLAIFSQLLNVFQSYYHYTVVTHRNRTFLRFHLFNSFLRLLHDGGINEYEDPDRPFPKGHVQVMTIHQAKGLEFPVVVVGSLSSQLSSTKQIDRELQQFYHRPPFEPENRITLFDRMRLHYVAFSRAQKLLVLAAHETPKNHFSPIWQGLPQWPYVEQDILTAQRFTLRDRMPVKKSYSFTGDLKVYETCPRQYQFFREYDFTPSRSAVIFFGLLVHQTIEEIHRIALDDKLDTLDEARIRDLFERTFRFLCLSDVRPIGDAARESAFLQVMNYFRQNQEEMRRVIQTEVDVSIEKDGYILVGKVDLLLGSDGKLELLDFKTSERSNDPLLLATYEDQLCTYAHILERRQGKRPERLLLYWTAEANKADALMEMRYAPEKVDGAGQRFEGVVAKIQARDFRMSNVPQQKVCKECDLRGVCISEGVLQ
jgi:DNA helicase II / ATP-dependent DNA helicase PcrA